MIFGYIDVGTGYTIVTFGSWLMALAAAFFGLFLLFFKRILGIIRKYKKTFIILALIILFLILITIGIFMKKQKNTFNGKVIVLGFDGLSPVITESMMDRGMLPNFSSLRQSGSYSRLATTNPPQSPVAWASFATGKNPAKTGIFDFIKRDPETYAISLALAEVENAKSKKVVKSHSFWHYTSQKNVNNIILECPVTFPPDKLNGKMLSGMGVPDILGTEGTFTFYTTQAPEKNKDTGGSVFHVTKKPEIIMNLIGPKVRAIKGEDKNITVPFKAVLGSKSIEIECQKNKFQLKQGQWSGWKDVTFDISMLKKIKGIFKFYLVETDPDLKLYISPINYDPRNPFLDISYPKQYSRELADNIGLYYTQGMSVDTWGLNEKRLTEEAFIEQISEVLRQRKAMLDFELNRFKNGILFCYFGTSDIIQHMFWRYRDSKHPVHEEELKGKYSDMIENWYIKMDNILGEVMSRMSKDDTLIVLSDHGFNTFRRAVHVNSWLRKNGYLQLINPDAPAGSELLSDIDWTKTRAYSIGFGSVYINQKGREKHGIVMPGGESRSLKEEIASKLEKWTDSKYNEQVISRVYKDEDIFHGDYAKDAPDLVIGFNIGYRASWQSAVGAVPQELIEDNMKKWSGDHLFDPEHVPGVLFTNRKITKKSPSIYDITPTLLKITGYDKEELKKCGFDGEPLY